MKMKTRNVKANRIFHFSYFAAQRVLLASKCKDMFLKLNICSGDTKGRERKKVKECVSSRDGGKGTIESKKDITLMQFMKYVFGPSIDDHKCAAMSRLNATNMCMCTASVSGAHGEKWHTPPSRERGPRVTSLPKTTASLSPTPSVRPSASILLIMSRPFPFYACLLLTVSGLGYLVARNETNRHRHTHAHTRTNVLERVSKSFLKKSSLAAPNSARGGWEGISECKDSTHKPLWHLILQDSDESIKVSTLYYCLHLSNLLNLAIKSNALTTLLIGKKASPYMYWVIRKNFHNML